MTSADSDVTNHSHVLVKPSGTASITSRTLARSSHPKMSSNGQELSSGEQSQYRGKQPTEDMVCPHATHVQVPPGTDMVHGTILPIRSVVPGVPSFSTTSTEATVTLQDSHTRQQPSTVSTGADSGTSSVHFSTENDPVSNWILVQPKHKSKICKITFLT